MNDRRRLTADRSNEAAVGRRRSFWGVVLLTLQILGGCREEGRAAFLLRADNRSWLLDCGVKRIIARDHVGEYPTFDHVDLAKLDAVILSHAHEDHCAALPLLYKMGYAGKVYCTPPTAELAVEYCLTWRKTVERHGFVAPYSADDVARVQFAPRNDDAAIDLGLQVTFAQSGHLVGSAMCHLEWQGHRIVYTGDVTFESRLFAEPCADLIGEAMIIDGSYGTRTLTREATEAQLLALIRAAVTQGGSALLPLPRFGRAQEVLLSLYEHRDELPPVFVEANIRDAGADYLKFKEWLRPGALEQLQTALGSPRWRFVESAAQRRDALQTAPAIFLATDAMLSNGAAVEYLRALAAAPRNSIIFTGYQAPGTLGRRLLEGARAIETAQGQLSVHAQVANVTLKAHPDYNENRLLIGQNNPRVFIAHSEEQESEDLERALRARGVDALAPAAPSIYPLV